MSAAVELTDGSVALEAGVVKEILTLGGGAQPSLGDSVEVRYAGYLPDGTVFDASDRHVQRTSKKQSKSGFSLTFGQPGLIDGWRIALASMTVGEKSKFYIPSPVAYGAEGFPAANIPADTDLTFEVRSLLLLRKCVLSTRNCLPSPSHPLHPCRLNYYQQRLPQQTAVPLNTIT
jgi:FKBP-type peptidyl-prolyl cis-trans isomerase FkpA